METIATNKHSIKKKAIAQPIKKQKSAKRLLGVKSRKGLFNRFISYIRQRGINIFP